MSEKPPSPECFKNIHPVYAHEEPEDPTLPSIFLAGPSPRSSSGTNWRPEALEELEHSGFKGNVFIPLPRNLAELDSNDFTDEMYDKQLAWEQAHLDTATVITFWIPRDLKDLPGFVTNVEFGEYLKSGKIVLGFPEGAAKMKALEWLATEHGVPVFHTLEETLRAGIELVTTLKALEEAGKSEE